MPPTGVLRDRRLLQPQLTTGVSLGKGNTYLPYSQNGHGRCESRSLGLGIYEWVNFE